MKIKVTKIRTLQSGREVNQLNKEIRMTISSMCPDKWLFVDLERGDVWHIKEDEYNQKHNYNFWRGATRKELQELKKLKVYA
jgi:hypothetical protein